MKKITLLLVVAAFLSCETKTVEVNTQVGKALYGDQNKLFAGNMDYAKTTIDVLKAYAA